MAPATVEIGDLRAFALLQDVEPHILRALLEAADLQVLEPGTVLIQCGQMPPRLHFLLEGSLAVRLESAQSENVALVGPGESVGELSILDGNPPCAWVVAALPCRVLSLEEDTAWALTRDSHAFCLALLRKLSERLRANNITVETSVRQRRQAEEAALLDGLTGVRNRRWIEEQLPGLASESNDTMALALLDIDHFKRFNDTYGHQAGDDVLVGVARALEGQLRPSDVVARYGGEEFVVALPGEGAEGASIVAERLRRSIAALALQSRDGHSLPPITISIGLAFQQPGLACGALVAAADQALYQAKEGGRNRVVVAGAPLLA
ncbi:GGDEF domain-containing protein [Synechococcus sp. CS-1328]|uniref:GGDEF domain-containing protein n=1 Tax=Synechococcus sp. CS-1328 TaxID=2847976 RepID=UPI00223BFCF1|nr:GGDEF domain-containing protein [Synechococcus sp. CS-1328]MCT0226488.1 GGDEF domain-containing protein [Synechococcus sp. CS-1328]